MKKVEKIEILDNDKTGCNNGIYDLVKIYYDNRILKGETCRCQCGCGGSWRIPEVGQEFITIFALFDFLES